MKPDRDLTLDKDDDKGSSACLLVFSKPATPGRVKTRLIGDLTAGEAAELHAAFLTDLIDEMRQGSFDLQIAWALAEGEEAPDYGTESMVQEGADLGERLHRALAQAAERFPQVAAIGSDHPELSASLVQEAFDKLARGMDMVLGPSGDGGYYLIGLHRGSIDPMIFSDIPWSSDHVFGATIAKARSKGLAIELLPEVPDVDTPADLDRLVGRVVENPKRVGRCTRSVLEALNLLEKPESRGENHEGP